MTVYFIGAGPGDPELMTVKGQRLIMNAGLVLYTGSLVPAEVVASAKPGARVADSASMTLEETVALMAQAHEQGQDVARVHTGDPTLFSAVAEQARELDRLEIPWRIVPGVSSFTAAAAALGQELTLPELSQTVIITRMAGRTPVPEKENLAVLAQSNATLALFLSVTLMDEVVAQLAPAYGADCPVAVVHKVSTPGQKVVVGTLADIQQKVSQAAIRSQAIILVGRVLGHRDFAVSKLYDGGFAHKFRGRRKQNV